VCESDKINKLQEEVQKKGTTAGVSLSIPLSLAPVKEEAILGRGKLERFILTT
jgi:tmRNA-binding protein